MLALLFGLTGTLLLSGAGHVLIELGGGPMALARYEAAWRETIRPLLIAATLVAYAVAATLGLGGCPAAREAPFLDGR